ncbi:MAG: BtrH N-terminal domain-containing protein, partial [Candidatus Helarchaeota archaeon]
PGKNCQLTSLRKILAYHELDISEEMLLGIASGLGFLYWNMKMMPFAFVGGLNGKNITIFENVMDRIGGKAELIKTGSLKISYKQFKDHLREGEPLIPFVDIAYLPYFFSDKAPYPNEEAGHFGGHTFVIYGLNEKENVVNISDRYNNPNTLTIQQFMDAHGSKFPPFASKNRKLKFIFPKKLPDLKPIIKKAIKENHQVMVNPPIKNLGLKGILKFKEMVKTWPKEYDAESLLFGLVMTWIYNQTGGTGGALFRNMYADFLTEASMILKNEKLSKAANIYCEAATAWDQVAACLLPDELPALKKIRSIYYQVNKIQEESAPNYQRKLSELDDQWLEYKKTGIEEAKKFIDYIPALQEAIQTAHDIEIKAWKILGNL